VFSIYTCFQSWRQIFFTMPIRSTPFFCQKRIIKTTVNCSFLLCCTYWCYHCLACLCINNKKNLFFCEHVIYLCCIESFITNKCLYMDCNRSSCLAFFPFFFDVISSKVALPFLLFSIYMRIKQNKPEWNRLVYILPYKNRLWKISTSLLSAELLNSQMYS